MTPVRYWLVLTDPGSRCGTTEPARTSNASKPAVCRLWESWGDAGGRYVESDASGQTGRRPPVRRSLVLVVACGFVAISVAVLVLTLSQSGHLQPRAVRAPATIAPPTHAVQPGPISARIVTRTHRMSAGSTMTGALLLTNKTAHAITLPRIQPGANYCAPRWWVVLTTPGSPKPNPATPASCLLEPFVVQPGRNRFPFTLRAQSLACAGAPLPCATLDNLTPGTYVATLIGNLPVPTPPRNIVRVHR
jgi:hypothetical protein